VLGLYNSTINQTKIMMYAEKSAPDRVPTKFRDPIISRGGGQGRGRYIEGGGAQERCTLEESPRGGVVSVVLKWSEV
jgi:hypothetical protein